MGAYMSVYGELKLGNIQERVLKKFICMYHRGVLANLSSTPPTVPPTTTCPHHFHYHTYLQQPMHGDMEPNVTYFNVLKFLITLRSTNAVAPSSPIPVHWYLSHSRLDKKIHQEVKQNTDVFIA